MISTFLRAGSTMAPRCVRTLFGSRTVFADRLYADTHEWITVEGGIGTVGISEHAQDALGDIVFVDLPETQTQVEAGSQAGTIESVKAASDVNSPASGTVTEVNEQLSDEPSLINKSCYGDGWLFKLKIVDEAQMKGLMNEQSYDKYLKSLED